jgi:hypothetical protein
VVPADERSIVLLLEAPFMEPITHFSDRQSVAPSAKPSAEPFQINTEHVPIDHSCFDHVMPRRRPAGAFPVKSEIDQR